MPSLEEMRSMLPRLNEEIQSNPNDAKLLCGRGSINLQLRNFQNAISDCTLAIAADPSMVEAYNYRFICYMQIKDWPHALKDANELVRLKPSDDSYSNRAAVYVAMNQLKYAIPDYAKAIQLNPRSAVAYDGLGEVAYRSAKYEQSIAYCNRALYLDPRMTEALYFRGKSYEALGKNALAKRDFESARSGGYTPGEPFIRMRN
jgi:tetratricopeptide (TPR) repeat protein